MSEKVPSGTKSSAMLNNNLLSSPPRPPSSQTKERRNPSITPRKFQRFFTPRSRVSSKPSAARKTLRDLAGPALNRCQTPSSPLKPISEENGLDGLPNLRGAKRRKIHHTPDRSACPLPSPLHTSPALLPTPDVRPGLESPLQALRARRITVDVLDLHEASSDEEEDVPVEPRSYTRPVPLSQRGLGGQLAQRMAGGMPGPSNQALRHPVSGGLPPVPLFKPIQALIVVSDWRTETADFYSKPEDVHMCSSQEGAARSIPFCASSCHSKSYC